MSKELVEQTYNAFGFIQNLYLEISYLIKEIEGLLQLEDERFQILRPSGYSVTSRTSTGLDPVSVEQWLTKSLTVFFCPEQDTEVKSGTTITAFTPELKVMFVNIRIMGKNIDEPKVTFGCIRNIVCKKNNYNKFENLVWEFSYNEDKIFKNLPEVLCSDNYCSFGGEGKSVKLYSVKNSDDVATMIVEPLMKIYH